MIDQLLANRDLVAVLAVVLRLAVAYQRGLTWPEYRTVHAFKRATFPALDRRYPGSVFVNSKRDYTDNEEFVAHVNGTVRRTWKRLKRNGASPHIINSLKRRELPDGSVQYSAGHLVWTHDDGSQTEAFLFRGVNGGTDVYSHAETSVLDPKGHLDDRQVNGDPVGVLRDALELEAEDG